MQINESFRKLIPPLSSEEYAQLEENCKADGIRDPLVVWRSTLIDGHNRYEIAQKHGLEFTTIEKEFEDETAVKIWMVINQFGRRNIGNYDRSVLALQLEDFYRAKAKEKQGERTDICQNSDKSEPIDTKKEIAKIANVSHDTIMRVKKIEAVAKPETIAAVRSGEKSINEVYKEIKIEEKKEEVKVERERLAEIGKTKEINIDFRHGDFEEVFADVPDGSVDCIIRDPRYPYEFIEVWSKLSRFAKRVLKPNGYCITYSGQMHLPEVIKRLSENLDYYWTFAVYHEGQTQIVNGVNLICRWKPVLIFQNGKKKLQNTFQDYFISEQREKNAHEWQQSKSGVAYLIEMFTDEGDLICEPFAGGGTTVKVAMEKKRRIIAAEIDFNTYNIAKGNL